MPFYTKNKLNPSVMESVSSKSADNNNTAPDTSSFGSLDNAAALRQKAESSAEKSNGAFTADDAKYGMAVELANSRLGQYDDVDDNKRKEMIDSIYENELGASTSGRDYRGENIATDIIGGMKDGINGFNTAIGNGLDFAFDNTIGNLFSLFGNDDVKNMWTGEDLAMIPDVIEDLALAAIPGVGVPLVIGKNAIQQSDNIAEALSGIDNVTRQGLTGDQRVGKATTAALTTGLSALPGIGKIPAKAKYLESASGPVEEGLRRGVLLDGTFPKRLERAKDAFKSAAKKADNADELKEAVKKASKEYDAQYKKIGDLKKAGEEVTEADKDLLKSLQMEDLDARLAYGKARSNPLKAVKDFSDIMLSDNLHSQIKSAAKEVPLENLYKRGPLRGKEKISSLGKGMMPEAAKATAVNNAVAIPVVTASTMGEYGGNPLEALGTASDMAAADPWGFGLAALAPFPKAKKLGKRVYTPLGKVKSGTLPAAMARGSAIGNWTEGQGENYVNKDYAMNEEELLRALSVGR